MTSKNQKNSIAHLDRYKHMKKCCSKASTAQPFSPILSDRRLNIASLILALHIAPPLTLIYQFESLKSVSKYVTRI